MLRTIARGVYHIQISNLPGAHADLATPVPIPNTVVKQIGPMVLPQGERVGWCRVLNAKGPLS